MQQLNRDNVIIWQGEFKKDLSALVANDDLISILANAESLAIFPFSNDQAKFGINYESFEFTFQDNPGNPATYDAVARKVTYYPPAGLVVGEQRILKYRFFDLLGNPSNEATITITASARGMAWRGHGPSYACDKVGGENTGTGSFALLERYFTDTNERVLPLETKANVDTDPNYIAPAVDEVACPLPGSTIPLYVFNAVKKAKITGIKLIKNGITVHDFILDHSLESPQPLILQVKPDSYNSMDISVLPHPLASFELGFEPGVNGSGGDALFVDAGAPVVKSFPNVLLAAPLAGDVYFKFP